MNALDRLRAGYQKFCQTYFSQDQSLFKDLVEQGQKPKVLVIGCCDSRVSPSIITQAEPGEIFTIRNVANLVPPFTNKKDTHHGVSAAIEFAVRQLQVEHIVVLGHSQCGGIKALVESEVIDHDSFISTWMSIAQKAKDEIERQHPEFSLDEKAHLCEQKALQISLNNLMTFPWIAEKVKANQLFLHAWYFDLHSGQLTEYGLDEKTQILYQYHADPSGK